jgi:hypothetical protein
VKEHVGRLTASLLRLCAAEDDENMLVGGVDACPSWLAWGVSRLLTEAKLSKRDNSFNISKETTRSTGFHGHDHGHGHG